MTGIPFLMLSPVWERERERDGGASWLWQKARAGLPDLVCKLIGWGGWSPGEQIWNVMQVQNVRTHLLQLSWKMVVAFQSTFYIFGLQDRASVWEKTHLFFKATIMGLYNYAISHIEHASPWRALTWHWRVTTSSCIFLHIFSEIAQRC